jgi:hypothetical protein
MSACPPAQKNFFATFVPLIRPMAKRLGTNEDLILALSAFEDSWGQDAHNQKLHNIFGITQAGGNNLSFLSYQSCCDYWERHFGNAVRNVQDISTFTANLRKLGYNSANSDYDTTLNLVYQAVVRYKKSCAVK